MARTRHSDETGEESYFVSMTDLMVGMLFIFIIMLMAFALNLREQEEEFDKSTRAIMEANETRREMLNDIKEALEQRGVKVFIDAENGVLRLPEELLFPRGEYELTEAGRNALAHLAVVLADILPCYTISPTPALEACLPDRGGRIEAIFIEGHTDDRAILSRMNNGIESNWQLSTARAIGTFNALTQNAPVLAEIDNDNHQRVLGVSGYAENRPVRIENNEEARAANRRIDLRFLMATPNMEELEKIRRELKTGVKRE